MEHRPAETRADDADWNVVTLVPAEAGTIKLAFSGGWSIQQDFSAADAIARKIAASTSTRRIVADGSRLAAWDSALVSFLVKLQTLCAARQIDFDVSALPAGTGRLVSLATSVPERQGTARGGPAQSFVVALGRAAQAEAKAAKDAVSFLGESMIAFAAFLRGRARYRPTDLWLSVQECGAQALPIVGIISLLVGMIFAFVGAIQLQQFGADIYVANLVAIAMAREMSAVMTGIVLAGRTGAAFAAQIAAMQGNEEVDALATLGISPVEFLVVPRMLALVLMTPLLCIFADLLGIIGGYIVGAGMLKVTSTAYLLQTQGAVTLSDFAIGIVKSGIFGVLIAVVGCLRGMKAGRSAAAVGDAATRAVVSSIILIIIADAGFAVMLNVLGL
jgi:phospholipid/cholesterol/gamma-HCH transport system permease protein